MIARLLIRLIELYRQRGGGRRLWVECNFTPSCSAYAQEALRKHGAFHGSKLAVRRIRRCNDPNLLKPVDDPVPDALPDI